MNLSVYKYPNRIRPPKPGPITNFYYWMKKIRKEEIAFLRKHMHLDWNLAKRHFREGVNDA